MSDDDAKRLEICKRVVKTGGFLSIDQQQSVIRLLDSETARADKAERIANVAGKYIEELQNCLVDPDETDREACNVAYYVYLATKEEK
jgi:hypothetical protein